MHGNNIKRFFDLLSPLHLVIPDGQVPKVSIPLRTFMSTDCREIKTNRRNFLTVYCILFDYKGWAH